MSEEEPDNPEPEPSREEQVALREYLRRLARREGGDLDSLCAKHPGLADAVRGIRRTWEEGTPEAALDLSTILSRQLRDLLAAHPAPPAAPQEPSSPDQPPSPTSFFRFQHRERPAPAQGLTPGRVVSEFRLVSVLGTGGMGQVWEAEQLSLGCRKVAVKFVRPDRVSAHQLDFFAREARAGGRLHHPGIVTVHASGESDGLQWIAMEYVEGDWTLRDFIDEIARQHEVPEGYDRKVARFVAEMADALQAAHDAGVIHRDLKPQNVLITPEDKPKVTDFGLARITDETAISQTGEFAGTYFYMSPEQVAARRMGIDHRTDIFSLGVILYEMLALRRPFQGDTSHQVAAQIVTKDPPDPRTIRSRVPRDLAVIAETALEKDKDRRYQSMTEFAADLRRFLGNEPILAKPPTRWQRVVKWSRRNPTKSVAAAAASLLAIALSGFLSKAVEAAREGTSVKRLSAVQDLEDLIDRADRLWPAYPDKIKLYEVWITQAQALVDELPIHIAKRDELRALARPRTEEERQRDRATHPEYPRLEELQRDIVEKQRALARRRGHEPEVPAGDLASVDNADAAALMERAEALLVQGRDDEAQDAAYAALDAAGDEEKSACEAWYQALEKRIVAAHSVEGLAKAEEAIAALQAEHEALDEVVDERRDWRFPNEQEDARWWHNQLTKLIEGLEGLAEEGTGLFGEEAISPEHGWSVPRRLALAQGLDEALAGGGEYDVRWRAALPEIAKAYPGLNLEIQVGLVPIGPDPVSGLWEFWHVQSGVEPARDADEKLVLTEKTGLVLVLLREGTFLMGAERSDPDSPNHDADARGDEGPVHEVELSAFFLSKHEMTQGQWERVTGGNPSHFPPDGEPPGATLRHPVERVDWNRGRVVLARLRLELPSEAQWEYACRAATNTPFSCSREAVAGHSNLADQAYERLFRSVMPTEDWDDGFGCHAPVGSLAPNAWGLHDVHGNVWEWCLDGYLADFYARSGRMDPVAPWQGVIGRVLRGGSFNNAAVHARSAARSGNAPSAAGALGVRPAGTIDPAGTGFRKEEDVR